MSNRKLLVLAAALVLAAPTAAHAMLADAPLEVIAARSELIVVVDIVKTHPAAKLTMKVPDSPKPVNTWFMKCTLRVTRVITENGKPPATGDAKPRNRTIDIFTRAPRPTPPGQPRIAVYDRHYASLQAGKSYVLILRKMAGRGEYYLPRYPRNYPPARPEDIKKIERMAQVAKWAWGKAAGGLQIALVPRQSRGQLRQSRSYGRDRDGRIRVVQGKSAYVSYVIALRSVATEPVAVNLHAGDRLVSVVATGPGGKTIKADHYAWMPHVAYRTPFSPKYTAVIQPGAVLFISPSGRGYYRVSRNLGGDAKGKWRLEATYTSARKAAAPDGRKLWTGTMRSAPAEIEVSDPPKAR